MADEKILQELQEIKAAALLAAKPILTMQDAAAFMGVTKCNLYKLVSAKRIPHYKSQGGKFTYFKRVELEQWLTAVRVPTNEELDTRAATRCATKGGVL
ncbi:MAG: helix-turn-helix domain-containing protein [Paludibacteraceae bacterium]|nr:helix-turn-helix domain-containing protein [Paludibacteraceae bacterium]